MLKITHKFYKKQSGFTLVEMLIGVLIIGVIGTATATGISQTFSGSIRSNDRLTAINNLSAAGAWITRDVRLSKNTITLNGDSLPINIEWQEYGQSEIYNIDYSLTGNTIYRNYSVDGVSTSSIIVAKDVSVVSGETSYTNYKFTIKLQSIVGAITEERTYVVYPRNYLH